MPRRHLATPLALCLLASCAGTSGYVEADEPIADPTLAGFEQELAPYGRWIDLPGTGLVWQPANVPAGWEPYTVGRWEWTDHGWLWVSGEPWGRIVFHYGRWGLDASLGWFWVPGEEWAPAWVAWRMGDDLVGWAPLGPGIGPHLDGGAIPPAWWTFVPARRFAAGPVRPHVFPRTDSARYFARSRPVPIPERRDAPGAGIRGVHPGPPPEAVQRWTGRPLPQRHLAPPAPGRRFAAPSPAAAAPPPTPRVAPPASGPAPAPIPTTPTRPAPVRPPEGTGHGPGGGEPVERGPGQIQRGGPQPVFHPRGAGRGARQEPSGKQGAAQVPAPAPAAPAPAPAPDRRAR